MDSRVTRPCSVSVRTASWAVRAQMSLGDICMAISFILVQRHKHVFFSLQLDYTDITSVRLYIAFVQTYVQMRYNPSHGCSRRSLQE